MKYLLDTNVIVAMFRGRQVIRDAILKVGFENCAVSEISVAELYVGAFKTNYDAHVHEIQFVIEHFSVVPISGAIEKYADIRAELEASGNRLDSFDLLIAATAITQGLTLVTHNTKHFERIPRLTVRDWER
ncbi:MAG: PIN domain-containing protein [Bacteroidales bacterium]|nr:PIN domain-containing protein [Bacteroidales bacterium]